MGRLGADSMNRSQRMQMKALICILGILFLVVVFVAGLLFALIGWELVHEPVVRKSVNVWIMEVEETGIRVYEEGQERTYGFAEGMVVPVDHREQVADVTLVDELVSQVVCKRHKVNGKVLAVDAGGVELQGIGYLPFSEDYRGYRLYDILTMCGPQDVVIGYDFADFVVEDGKICSILLVKEAVMEYIRVLIKTGDYQALLHETVTFTCDTDFAVEYGAYGQRVQEMHHAGEVCSIRGDSVMFRADSKTEGIMATAEGASGRVRIVPEVLTGKVILQNVSRSQGTPAYRGTLEIVKMEDGLAVINEVLLEEYLYSVIPSEMPASYPKEALKAQAICARTYAYRHMLHAGLARYGAHVDDSTGYQVYNNIAEHEAATTAVKETFGQVLFAEDGSPAETYYYSTSCGIGSDGDVWNMETGGSPTYLSPQPISRLTQGTDSDIMLAQVLMDEDKFAEFIHSENEADYEAQEPWYRWSYTVTDVDGDMLRDRLLQRYQANPQRVLTQDKDGAFVSRPIGEWKAVKDICIVSRGPGGVAKELLIETDKNVYKVLTEYNIRYVLCDTISKVHRQDGSLVNAPSLLPSAYCVVEPLVEEGCVTGYIIVGGGYGHGVGMSQNGARNMAEEGMMAEGILTFFYHGCQVKDIYGTI
ncbi:MAG: SpoIID/LytB domain-containing protein [Lachnospiraceae bacterium]|nr:SpoIID/LytB domain-containing protein [Lachnospiraceae bacterium]